MSGSPVGTTVVADGQQNVISGKKLLFKAVVKFEHPRIPAFQPFMKPVSYFLRKQFHAVQCLYQLWAAILPQTPLLAARADKAGRVIAQIDRAVPLKVRVC